MCLADFLRPTTQRESHDARADIKSLALHVTASCQDERARRVKSASLSWSPASRVVVNANRRIRARNYLKQDRGGGAGVEFGASIAKALRAELGSNHRTIKTVMRWTGASERAVKHGFAGTHGPRGEHLVALSRHSDEVFRAFLLLADRGPAILTAKLAELRSKLPVLIRGREAAPSAQSAAQAAGHELCYDRATLLAFDG
jgi:hypothetical protein